MRNVACISSLSICFLRRPLFQRFSQTTTLLRGTITDPQGGVIAGAVRRAEHAGTGFTAR